MPPIFDEGAHLEEFIPTVVDVLLARKIISAAECDNARMSFLSMFIGLYTKIPNDERLRGGLVTVEIDKQHLTTPLQDGRPQFTLCFVTGENADSENKALMRKLNLNHGKSFGVILMVDASVRIETAVPADPVTAFGENAWKNITTHYVGLSSCCNRCGLPRDVCKDALGHGLKTCSRCSLARYCSESCQHLAWPVHKRLCKAVSVDLTRLDAALISSRFSKVARLPENYIEVHLGHATAEMCVSRAPALIEGQWRSYLGISTVQVEERFQGTGEMMRLIEKLVLVAVHMKRCLCITEVRAERLQRILQKHPEAWAPYAWVAGDTTLPESFVYLASVVR